MLFYVFAALAVISALGMVLNVRNTVASAMSLVVTMIALAGIYLLLEAYLVAVVQIMVYAGAIVVLFLFVVMLLNLRSDNFAPGRQRLVKAGALLLDAGRALRAAAPLRGRAAADAAPSPRASAATARSASRSTRITCCWSRWRRCCLLAAIVGALILAKRRID